MQVGQKVIYRSRWQTLNGAISAVDGEPRSHVVKEFDSAVVYRQGDATLSIVFEDGSQRSVYERELTRKNSDFVLLDEVLTSSEMEYLLELNKAVVEIRKMSQEHEAEYKTNLKQQLKKDNPHLITLEKGLSRSNCAAKNIRIELKQAFPGVKFSVRQSLSTYSMCIDVTWTGGPGRKEVDDIIDKYQTSDFDGMTDSDVPRNNVWTDVFGGARFVSAERRGKDDA